MGVRFLRWICLVAGIVLLGVIVAKTDVEQAAHLVVRMEWGIAVVLLISESAESTGIRKKVANTPAITASSAKQPAR